jgi:hypothetical protein
MEDTGPLGPAVPYVPNFLSSLSIIGSDEGGWIGFKLNPCWVFGLNGIFFNFYGPIVVSIAAPIVV